MKRKLISDIISIEELNELLSYNHESGLFSHKTNTTRKRKGEVAGFNNNGYIRITVNRQVIAAHRLAWFIVNNEDPQELIDHKNGIKTDNRISNLRLATYSQNSMNSKISSLNSTGFKGVRWCERKKRWITRVKINGKKTQLGSFTNINDASNAYCEFAKKHHGEYYRNS
ncbi:HNH endonuclease [Yersinia sp. 2540 StPb PI]|uniref:HNH endonuclease n=1 Tax=Yersinia sp. 2540 StPb PI TaxID=3117406 RepID=UPI003FA40AAC